MKESKIKEARKVSKITQDELAEKLGVNRATISKYESGVISPSVSQLHKIAKILQTPIYNLLESEAEESYWEGFDKGTDMADWDHRMIDTLWKDEGYSYSDKEVRLINAFSKLNEEGQQKAVERTEELLEVPKYKKSPEE